MNSSNTIAEDRHNADEHAKAHEKTSVFSSEISSALNPSDRAFWFGLAVVGLSVVSALVSYLILTGLTSVAPRNEVVWLALAVNAVLILTMLGILVWQSIGLWRAWRQRIPGARLHVRIVALFSLISALPAILLAVAATTTFSRSLDGWFSTRTRSIIENAYDVAQAYVSEHGQVIRNDVVNMVRDIDAVADEIGDDQQALQNFLIGQAGLRDITAAYIIDDNGVPDVMALDDARLLFIVPAKKVVQQAEGGQVPVLMPEDGNRMTAVAKLHQWPGKYLYVARAVSPQVMNHIQRTQENAVEYRMLRRARGGLKVAHALIYFMISMTAMLASIWVGMWFAGRFVAPIRRLIAGAQQVSQGNLEVTLPERRGEGDLRRLSQTFNHMTRELKSQQTALVTTNAELSDRSKFIEAVLSGVTAGVIGLDSSDKITLVSRAAEELLGLPAKQAIGQKLQDVIPEFAEVLTWSEENKLKTRGQFEIKRHVDGEDRTFAVQVTRERADEGDVGSVVTYDDVSELVQAQRTSAWADVARRIAHEIKNPLTPIQLSAERLRRRFGKQISDNLELFETLTQTIERQTGHIKGMVDEFASFARMPQPVMSEQDLRNCIRESAILFREGNSDVELQLHLPEKPVTARFDMRLVSQAVTNLIKNATEAIEGYRASDDAPDDYKGFIEVFLREGEDRAEIEVIDNGIGLPKQNRTRLLEPYVTTRDKGTGLGLAIVQKIVEQHNGRLELEDAPVNEKRERGALVRLTLPLNTSTNGAAVVADNKNRETASSDGTADASDKEAANNNLINAEGAEHGS